MLDLLVASDVLGAEAPVVAHQDHDALNCTGPGDADEALAVVKIRSSLPSLPIRRSYEHFVTHLACHLCHDVLICTVRLYEVYSTVLYKGTFVRTCCVLL